MDVNYYKINSMNAKRATYLLSALREPICVDSVNHVVYTPFDTDRCEGGFCGELRALLVKTAPPANTRYKNCGGNVLKYIKVVEKVGGRVVVDAARRFEALPPGVYCFYKHKIAAQCRGDKMPSWLTWQLAREVNEETYVTLIEAALGGKYIHRFWPSFFDYFRGAGFVGSLLVFGGSMAGKTYTVRRVIDTLSTRFLVVDSMGEFLDKGHVVELAYDVFSAPLEAFMAAFDAAMAVFAQAEQGANWTAVQAGYLRRLLTSVYDTAEKGRVLGELMTLLQQHADPKNITAQILLNKLSNLCASFEITCEPYSVLTEPLKYCEGKKCVEGPEALAAAFERHRVVVLDARLESVPEHNRRFVRTLLVHILLQMLVRSGLLKKLKPLEAREVPGFPKPRDSITYLVLDEAHMYIPPGNRQDVLTTILRQGRHGGLAGIFITQSIDDLKYKEIAAGLIFFALNVEEDVYGIPADVLRTLRPGEGIVIHRLGAFYIPP